MVRGEDPVELDKIDRIYKHLRRDSTILSLQDSGAGSVSGAGQFYRIKQIVKYSSISRKYGRLLFRLVRWVSPSTIIELGTGAGFSTMYMALACDPCKVLSIEGCPEIASLAIRNIKSIGMINTEIILGSFHEILPSVLQKMHPPLFVFIDGDHRGERLTGYYETILSFNNENTVFVFDDIRWSKSMEKSWNEIIKREEVSISIDLFRMGILFLKRGSTKRHFIIKF